MSKSRSSNNFGIFIFPSEAPSVDRIEEDIGAYYAAKRLSLKENATDKELRCYDRAKLWKRNFDSEVGRLHIMILFCKLAATGKAEKAASFVDKCTKELNFHEPGSVDIPSVLGVKGHVDFDLETHYNPEEVEVAWKVPGSYLKVADALLVAFRGLAVRVVDSSKLETFIGESFAYDVVGEPQDGLSEEERKEEERRLADEEVFALNRAKLCAIRESKAPKRSHVPTKEEELRYLMAQSIEEIDDGGCGEEEEETQ